MAEADSVLVQKVEAHEKDLLALYGQVYSALHSVERKGYSPTQLAELDRALDPPNRIAAAKAIAVIKAIMGSTSDDKLSMEMFYSVPFDSTTSIGAHVSNRVRQLGLGYHDFWPFLRVNGWLNT